ncbi:hypothetical protein, partial [Nostoc sp.]|uniref:hypothetical protein n=1 Tax=Nostoc sp. TaxID=1180 RepID=UPI002FF7700D
MLVFAALPNTLNTSKPKSFSQSAMPAAGCAYARAFVPYPSSVTLRKLLPFLNSRAFVYEAIARLFSNN